MKAIGSTAAAVVVTVAIAVVRSRTPERQQDREAAAPRAVAVDSQMVTLRIPQMDCAGCEVGVRIAAGRVDGVTRVNTDSDKRTAEVTFDPSRTTAQAIAAAITKGTGFEAEVPPPAKSKT